MSGQTHTPHDIFCHTCGLHIIDPLWEAFHCFYCLDWFCEVCAAAHFGQTREQWQAEHPASQVSPAIAEFTETP